MKPFAHPTVTIQQQFFIVYFTNNFQTLEENFYAFL